MCIYLFYYAVLIGFDLMGKTTHPAGSSGILTFERFAPPEKVTLADVGFDGASKPVSVAAPASIGLGGVFAQRCFRAFQGEGIRIHPTGKFLRIL